MTYPSVALGELMAAKKSSIDPRKSPDEEFELFSIPAFDAGVPEIRSGGEIGSSKQVVMDGDVLLSRIVPHIRRAWAVMPMSGCRTIGSSEWIIFRSDRFDPQYLRHALVSDQFHQAFMQTVAGVGGSLLRARPAHVANIEIPLPPIEEQRRTAAVLDVADALRAKRRQAVAKLDTLTQAIFIDMFGGRQHAAMPLSDVAEVQGGLQVTSKRASNPVEVPYLRVANVYRGLLDLSEIKLMRVTQAELDRTRLAEGDLLVVEGHGNPSEIGRVAVWNGEVVECVHQNHLIRVRCDADSLRPRLAETYMNSQLGRRALLRAANTTSGLNTISTGDVRAVSVPVPPLEDQDRFVAIAESVDRHRAKLFAGGQALDDLLGSLKQRAFRGEL